MNQLVVDNINFMKKSITRHKDLIPHDDAIVLARKVQLGLNHIEAAGFARTYLASALNALKNDKVVYLGLKARNTLVTGNMRFALKKAYYYNGSGLDNLDDAVQAVNLKLVEAIEKFDPEKGYRVTTYIDFFIKQAVFIEKKKHQATSLKVSTHLLQIKYTYAYRVEKLTIKLGRTPTKSEIALDYKVSEAVLEKALAIPREVSVFETRGVNEDGTALTVLDFVESPNHYEESRTDFCLDALRGENLPANMIMQQMLYPNLFAKLRCNDILNADDLVIVNQLLKNIEKNKL
jgi:RNA polymerase sigma factor (sigma-70 family)